MIMCFDSVFLICVFRIDWYNLMIYVSVWYEAQMKWGEEEGGKGEGEGERHILNNNKKIKQNVILSVML